MDNELKDTELYREHQMFGASVKMMRDSMKHWAGNDLTVQFVVASMLSDAQELLARGETEKVRLVLNRAKFFLLEEQ